MSVAFQYDQNQAAADTGGNGGTKRSLVSRGFIRNPRWTLANNTQAQFLEFDFETDTGAAVNYLSICFMGKDGSPVDFGQNRIQAIMGCTGVKQLSRQQGQSGQVCPELNGKPVALALEKHNYRNGRGEVKWKHEIKAAMSPRSWLTVAENAEGITEPKTKAYWVSEFEKNSGGIDDPSMKNAPQGGQQGGTQGMNHYGGAYGGGQPAQGMNGPPANDFDDEIPF